MPTRTVGQPCRGPRQLRDAIFPRIRAEHESTVATNVYLVGDDLKLQADASWLRAGTHADDWRVRVQANVAF